MLLNADQRAEVLKGLAEILETPVTPETRLDETNFDSMAVVMVVALLDDKCGVLADGPRLSDCTTVGEVLALAEAGA